MCSVIECVSPARKRLPCFESGMASGPDGSFKTPPPKVKSDEFIPQKFLKSQRRSSSSCIARGISHGPRLYTR
jgi:hypothetical protein